MSGAVAGPAPDQFAVMIAISRTHQVMTTAIDSMLRALAETGVGVSGILADVRERVEGG